MRIENNLSFQGRIKSPVKSKNKLVRYSINYLKHHVGGRNVEHELFLNEAQNSIGVFTRLFPKSRTKSPYSDDYSFNTIKRLDLISPEKITQQAKELANWIKQVNKY